MSYNVGGSYDYCNNYNDVAGSYDYCNNVGGAYDRKDNKKDFVLIVVLFILLIIIGTEFKKWC
ncbi:YjcZ family sporulation protein [Lysinibacillus telephonicus]|uniref:YjcZ family sporulation protein n=1 Tax=Lysinibacillus telephonicus TaxID=1714840 RepID=A0A3S0J483_9BACI|nr:YjcZ family sporulation protein [Lysinibacillus telephonicus]RTQ94135.1 YjcZ family sporulation protein [Lysinibacillus telephonicus]